MSGILASSVIKKNCSCKLYTNSSGNPASITIHSVVPSTTDNACLTIKASATDACIFTNTVVDTADVPLVDTVSIVSDTSGYQGYTCMDTGQSKFLVNYAYVDCAGTETVPFASRNVRDSGASCLYTSNTNYRITNCRCLTLSFCCTPCTELLGCDNRCPSLFRILNTNLPNFHTPTSGEKHKILAIDSCNFCARALVDFSRSDCCCGIDLTTPAKKYESYLTPYDFANNPSEAAYCNRECCSKIGLIVSDLWSDFGTTVIIDCLSQPSQCQYIYYSARSSGGSISNKSLGMCCAQCTYELGVRRVLLNCCNCFACCERENLASCHVPFPAIKTVMMGCDVTFFQDFRQGQPTWMVVYPYACYNEMNSSSPICALEGPFGRFGSCQCVAACHPCKTKIVGITGISGGAIKWVWYNPYVNCNYFFIMPHTGASDTCKGIFTFEPSCLEPFCHVDNCGDNTYNTNLCTHLGTGFIQKAGDIPDVWTRYSCFEGDPCTGADYNAYRYTAMSNPVLVGERCWAVWAQCYNWGDRDIGATGWNGCFLRYHSNDLINWSLTEDSILLGGTSGTGDAVCSVCYETDAANFTQYVDHFFNSANCVSDASLLEYKTSANRLERTGIVLGDGDSIYVNNSGEQAGVTIWGYDE